MLGLKLIHVSKRGPWLAAGLYMGMRISVAQTTQQKEVLPNCEMNYDIATRGIRYPVYNISMTS